MASLSKVTLYFFSALVLYFLIGILACNIPFPVLGMVLGGPSVIISAVILAFARTLEVYMQGNYSFDFKDYLYALIYLFIIIMGILFFIACIYAIYICYFIVS